MVVDDLDILGASLPPKTNPPLVVDADAVLPTAISPQCLQAVSRRGPQVVQLSGGSQHAKFTSRHPLDSGETPNGSIIGECFGVPTAETLDHPGNGIPISGIDQRSPLRDLTEEGPAEVEA
jgi:hypothetical protein